MIPSLYGIIPPATTPFGKDGEIDFEAVEQQVDWLICNRVHGVAAGGSTGEGHTLNVEEFRDVVKATVQAADERVPVVAGIIVDSTRDAVRRGEVVADMGVAALQVTPVHYLFRPDDDSMLEHFKIICAETGLPVIIYNVVPWSYLSPELLCRIMREVPGVVGVKQSASDLKLFADLIIMSQAEDLIFCAVDALLYSSYTLGARGSIAAILTAAPQACVDLWEAVEKGDHARARDLHERLLVLWNAISADNLPACVKYAQTLQGCPGLYPRAPMPEASEQQRGAIRRALDGLGLDIVEDA